MSDPRGLTRRGLLGRAGGAVLIGGVAYALPRPTDAGAAGAAVAPVAPVAPAVPLPPAQVPVVPFHGPHQAGIATPRPAHVVLTSYDLRGASLGLHSLFSGWSRDARALTAGTATGGATDAALAGSGPARLTVTVGVGGTLLDRSGVTRPTSLAELPAFPGEQLDPARSGGDLCVQVCADDPLVAVTAARTLTSTARPYARVRWQQRGFGQPTGNVHVTPRNLMGQVDGTDDVVPAPDQLGGPIWVGQDADPAWLRGGSVLVYRRIRMLLEEWDRTPLPDQERVIGRDKRSGAPLGATGEHDPLNLVAKDRTGALVVPADAHVRLAHPSANRGALMHRRGFSYDDGLLPGGEPDAGLMFLAFQSDPAHGFTPVQQRLAASDALNAFTVHTASAVFAMLPGLVDDRDTYGRTLPV